MEGKFSTDGEGWGGMVQVVIGAMGSDAEQQMKLHSRASCSPPAVHRLPNRPQTYISVRGPGVGDPCYKGKKSEKKIL